MKANATKYIGLLGQFTYLQLVRIIQQDIY